MSVFFNNAPTTEIYTLSLHDALPISHAGILEERCRLPGSALRGRSRTPMINSGGWTASGPCACELWTSGEPWTCELSTCGVRDRKSTRLNSSHANISYAVFCL